MILYIDVFVGFAIESILMAYYYVNMLTPKMEKTKAFLFSFGIMLVIGTIILFTAYENYYIRSSVAVITYFLPSMLLFKDKLKNRIFVTLSYMLVIAISEMAGYVFCLRVLNIDVLKKLYQFSYEKIVHQAILYTLGYLIILTILKFYKKKIEFTSKLIGYIIIYLSIQLFIIYIFWVAVFQNSTNAFYAVFLLFTSLLSTCFAILLSRLISGQSKKEMRLQFTEEYTKMQQNHLNIIKHQTENLKKIKHDYNNHLAIINELINTHKYAQTQTYIKELSDEIEENINYTFCKNPIADTILVDRYAILKEKGIKADFRANIPNEICILDIELGSLLTNLIDNAITATEQCKGSFIKFNAFIRMGYLVINIINPCVENVDIENLTTTKENKANHGYGIKILKSIIEKYNGNIVYECKDKIFEVTVNLKIKKPPC